MSRDTCDAGKKDTKIKNVRRKFTVEGWNASLNEKYTRTPINYKSIMLASFALRKGTYTHRKERDSV